MGCFTVLKSKKKKSDCPVHITRIKPQDCTSTVLPEPKIQIGNEGRTLQSAPSSFNTRTKPVQIATKSAGGRRRTISDPSTLVVPDHDVLSSVECDDHDDSKRRVGVSMELRTPSPSPQPLPLPSSQSASVLKNTNSFKSGSLSPLYASGPLPLPPVAGLRNFSYEEIASACQQFSHDRFTSEGLSSVIYKASFGDDTSSSKKLEATVTRLPPSSQGFKEFVNEVNIIASLQHPHLCKLLGYHARDGSDHRMLVYERLAHGSLDFLLFGGSSGLPIDWGTRIKVALCAAQGLAFLHEEGPFQAMYNEISTANIQIDKDFSAKLSGYGCVNSNTEPETSNSSPAETIERGLITPKSNVWSFGIVILELLTGRKNLDARYPKEERNLAKWSKPYLADDFRLSLVIDPRLKGRYPTKAVRAVADIALKCLQNDPSERPTMRAIVESLKNAQEIKYSLRFPLQEPSAASKHMSRSPSLNGIYVPTPRFSFTHSSPLTMSQPLNCSSIENNLTQESRRSASSIITRRNGVEGF